MWGEVKCFRRERERERGGGGGEQRPAPPPDGADLGAVGADSDDLHGAGVVLGGVPAGECRRSNY